MILATSFCFKVMGILWERIAEWGTAFCAVAKVPDIVRRVMVSTVLPSQEKVGVTLLKHVFFLKHVSSSVRIWPQRRGFPNGM